jgi:multimeric flavodoxin WrbA
MQKIFSWLDRAGAVVLSTPVYFYGFPSSAKAVIDRCHPLWHDPVWRQKPKRPAFFLANCAASRNQEFNVILQEGRAFLNTVGFKIQAKLLVPGMDRKDANQRLRWAEKRARALARRWQPKPP